MLDLGPVRDPRCTAAVADPHCPQPGTARGRTNLLKVMIVPNVPGVPAQIRLVYIPDAAGAIGRGMTPIDMETDRA